MRSFVVVSANVSQQPLFNASTEPPMNTTYMKYSAFNFKIYIPCMWPLL